jgi:hypothetical protein
MPDLTIPEIVEVINPPHKALGVGYFASLTLRSPKSTRAKAFLRLNIRPGGALLVDRGYFALTSSGMLDMTHARLQGVFEYRMAEGLLILAVQRLREDRALRDVRDEKTPQQGVYERLEAFARGLTKHHKYPMRHAVTAMVANAKRVAAVTGCEWRDIVEWSNVIVCTL